MVIPLLLGEEVKPCLTAIDTDMAIDTLRIATVMVIGIHIIIEAI